MTDNEDYQILLDLFIDLVQAQAGNKVKVDEGWLNDAQTLSIKLFRHLVSMHVISVGSTIEHNGTPVVFFVDHGSVKVLARAALETYLVFYYLFGCKDRNLSKFRHNTWVLGGLIDRQSSHASIEEHRIVLENEKKQIEELQSVIGESEHLNSFTPNQQKQLLNGKWRVGKGWTDLGISAGFHKKYFENIYNYLCGYSHSSYISALQVGQALSIEEQKNLTSSILDIGVVIMAHYAFSYSEIFVSAAEVLNRSADAKTIAEKWHFGSEDMAEIYDR